MEENKAAFPTVEELIEFAFSNISIDKYNNFPDDEWYTFSEYWDINICREGVFNLIYVYPHGINDSENSYTDIYKGIIIYKNKGE